MASVYSRVCFTTNLGGVPQFEANRMGPDESVANAISTNPRNGTLNKRFTILDLGPISSDPGSSLRLAATTSKDIEVNSTTGRSWQQDKV